MSDPVVIAAYARTAMGGEEYMLLAQGVIINPMLNGETIRLDGAMRMASR
jgi:hypothetical protein